MQEIMSEQRAQLNYLCFGKPNRRTTDKNEVRKRGTEEERKSLKSVAEEHRRRTKNSPPQATKKLTARVLSHRTGQGQEPPDISWPSSPIGTVSCTAFVLSHRTGGPPEAPDISWPPSPVGTVSCTACVLCHRTGQGGGGGGEEEEEDGTEKNLTTTTLTVANSIPLNISLSPVEVLLGSVGHSSLPSNTLCAEACKSKENQWKAATRNLTGKVHKIDRTAFPKSTMFVHPCFLCQASYAEI